MALSLTMDESKRIDKRIRIKPVRLRARKKGLRALACPVV